MCKWSPDDFKCPRTGSFIWIGTFLGLQPSSLQYRLNLENKFSWLVPTVPGNQRCFKILLRCKRTSCVLDGLPLTDSYGSTRETLPSLRITAESLTRAYRVMTSDRTLDGRITILAKGRRLSYSTWLPTRTIEPDPSRITSTIGVLKKPLEFLQNRRLLSHRSTNCLRLGH